MFYQENGFRLQVEGEWMGLTQRLAQILLSLNLSAALSQNEG